MNFVGAAPSAAPRRRRRRRRGWARGGGRCSPRPAPPPARRVAARLQAVLDTTDRRRSKRAIGVNVREAQITSEVDGDTKANIRWAASKDRVAAPAATGRRRGGATARRRQSLPAARRDGRRAAAAAARGAARAASAARRGGVLAAQRRRPDVAQRRRSLARGTAAACRRGAAAAWQHDVRRRRLGGGGDGGDVAPAAALGGGGDRRGGGAVAATAAAATVAATVAAATAAACGVEWGRLAASKPGQSQRSASRPTSWRRRRAPRRCWLAQGATYEAVTCAPSLPRLACRRGSRELPPPRASRVSLGGTFRATSDGGDSVGTVVVADGGRICDGGLAGVPVTPAESALGHSSVATSAARSSPSHRGGSA